MQSQSNTQYPSQFQLMNQFHDHFVLMLMTFPDTAPSGTGVVYKGRRIIVVSGFVWNWRDRWCWVSAGHIVKALDDLRSNGFPPISCRLLDRRTIEGGIPIEINSKNSLWVNRDDGIDFSVTEIPDNTRQLLEKTGVTALRTPLDVKVSDVSQFMALGLPTCLETVDKAGIIIEEAVCINFQSNVKLVKTDQRPYGQLACSIPEDVQFKLDGMSGGPLFGLCRKDDGYWHLCIMGLIYSAAIDGRTLYALPLSSIYEILEDACNRRIEERGIEQV